MTDSAHRATMCLGLEATPFGHHPAAWRLRGTIRSLDFALLAAQVTQAERAGLDFVLFDDHQGRRPTGELPPGTVPFEPTTLLAGLATTTTRIGLVATASTAQHEPYNLARRFASLDLISRGRVGWNLVMPDEGGERDAEHVTVVTGLWNSWEDDAFVYDKAAGRFFLPEKMHVLNHAGTHYTVRGPLNVNPSPQGQPVITHRVSPGSLRIAARDAEVIILAGDAGLARNASLVDSDASARRDLRACFEACGRNRAAVRILAPVMPWIGASRAEAQASADRLDGLDPAGSPGDALIGTVGDIADVLEQRFGSEDIDGFLVRPPSVPEGLDGVVDGLVPELRRRGLVREGYAGTTLREHLGLRRPPHPAAVIARNPR